jgi:hypothetical protein
MLMLEKKCCDVMMLMLMLLLWISLIFFGYARFRIL